MHISKRDSIFAVSTVIILALLISGTGKKLGRDVSATEDHLVFYQQWDQGGSRIELEKGCVVCHEIESLSATHPHKEECMVCHCVSD